MIRTKPTATTRNAIGVDFPAMDDIRFLRKSCAFSVTLYPYSRMIRPMKKTAREPESDPSWVTSGSVMYARMAGIRKNRDRMTTMSPRGARNLLLFSGSAIIFVRM